MAEHLDQSVCPASREAIWGENEFDCPLCWRPAEQHRSEKPYVCEYCGRASDLPPVCARCGKGA